MSDDLFDTLMELEGLTPQIRESYIRAPFGWPGGKWNSLREIIPLLPQGRIFYEGCGGSGIITINSPDWYTLKVFNDRHAGIVAFYRCLRDSKKKDQMKDWLACQLHAREEFIWCRDTWKNCEDDVERACRWYYMLRTSFSQLGRNWARTINHHSMIAKKLHASIELFDTIHDRFKDVQIENIDVVKGIADFDSPATVHYIDPDYIGASPIYEHTVEHRKLLNTVFGCKGWFGVSNYRNELYDSYPWDEIHKWEVPVPMTSAAFSDTNNLGDKGNVMDRSRKAVEILYIKHSEG